MNKAETAAFLARVADAMMERHTPFAVSCKDPGCNCKSGMRDPDWIRYYGMVDLAEWLRSQSTADMLSDSPPPSPTAGLPDDLLWETVFGTDGDSWSWWVGCEFLDGDWHTVGRVRLEIRHPDNPHDSIERVVTITDVRAAIDKIALEGKHGDVCTGKFPVGPDMDSEWDACVSDLVLQTMVLGEVVYG